MTKFKFYPEDDDCHATISTTPPEADADSEIVILGIDERINVSSMESMADALNVLAETGQTPRQLAEQVKVLREALRAASNHIDTLGGVSQRYRAAIVQSNR